MAADKAALRAYVMAGDAAALAALAPGTILVRVTHSLLRQEIPELRLMLSSSIAEVKRKLYTHCGSSVASMTVELYDGGAGGARLAVLSDDSRPLGYYGAATGMRLHVIDGDPASLARDGGLDDVSRVEKYRMSDADYEAREGTLRAYKKAQLALDPNFRFGSPPPPVHEDYLDPACVAGAQPGQRCEVAPGSRRGTVRWVGDAVSGLAAGFWVGVELDEPRGMGTGARGGVEYFPCADKHGAFVRPDRVSIGYFPTVDEEVGAVLGAGGSSGEQSAMASGVCVCEGDEVAAPAAPPAPAAAARVVQLKHSAPKRRGQEDDDDDDGDDEI